MKNLIKIIVLVIGFAIINSGCYAQRTISLRAFEVLKNNYQDGIDKSDDGDDITYIKDIDNELDKFVGSWKGSINNRNYEISFVKKIAYKFDSDDEKSKDLLVGWITVKNNAGTIIYTNTNKREKSNGFNGSNFQTGTSIYRLNFTGNCYNDSGNASLYFDQAGKLKLTYGILSDIKSDDCPNGFIPVLPTAGAIILTKQILID